MNYCTKCVAPSTKPNLTFDDEGVCSACRNHEKKKNIAWDRRWQLLDQLVRANRIMGGSIKYDILIPVSGGKDSIAQVYYAVEKLNLKVLAVSVDYGIKTEIGKYNLNLIPNIGCDLVIFKPNQKVHKRLVKQAFLETGTPDSINHPLLYCYPIHLAEELNVPLVMFGENPAFEYTGDSSFKLFQSIDQKWYGEYISYNNDFLLKIKSQYFIGDVKYYFLPSRTKTRTLFLSDYIFWDSESNLKVANQYGFNSLDRRTGTYRGYSGIDEQFHYLHQRIKFLKFGYGRATDHACEDIRNNRLDRKEAQELVEQYDGEQPDKQIIDNFCEYIDITYDEFWKVMKDKNRSIV